MTHWLSWTTTDTKISRTTTEVSYVHFSTNSCIKPICLARSYEQDHDIEFDPCTHAYLLGLLAMIKCSICSYQCENWYLKHCFSSFHINLSTSSWKNACILLDTGVDGLAQPPSDAEPSGVPNHHRNFNQNVLCFLRTRLMTGGVI